MNEYGSDDEDKDSWSLDRASWEYIEACKWLYRAIYQVPPDKLQHLQTMTRRWTGATSTK